MTETKPPDQMTTDELLALDAAAGRDLDDSRADISRFGYWHKLTALLRARAAIRHELESRNAQPEDTNR